MDVSIIVMDPMFLDGHWEELDASGFDSLYVIDHPYMTTPDPWPLLAYVAARTERIRLGTHVTAAPFHHPTELASAVATVDVLSKGRARLGIGAGYNRADFEPFGFPRPPLRERLDRLEEMMQVLVKLWSEEKAEFEGSYFQLRGGANLLIAGRVPAAEDHRFAHDIGPARQGEQIAEQRRAAAHHAADQYTRRRGPWIIHGLCN